MTLLSRDGDRAPYNRTFIRWTAAALICGGALTVLINATLSPFLPEGVPFSVTAMSSVFFWRQAASALAAALLLFGSVGLYLRQADRAGRAGAAAFAAAFIGSALLLGNEWSQVFDVRDLAMRMPAALNLPPPMHGFGLSDLGALIVLSVFTLGWIALAAVTARLAILSRGAAIMLIAGSFAIPLSSVVLHPRWGAVLGNAILGSGLCWLGYSLLGNSQHG